MIMLESDRLMTDKRLETVVPSRQENSAPQLTLDEKQRQELIYKLQKDGMEQADPLIANLQILTAEVIQVAYLVRDAITGRLSNEPMSEQRFPQIAPRAELFLKCVRQVDRLAQIKRQSNASGRAGSEP
jgi:hypothetical protein